MKKAVPIVIGVGVILLFGLAFNSYRQTQQTKQLQADNLSSSSYAGPRPSAGASAGYTLATVSVSGFDCPTCPAITEKAIKNSDGVLDANMTTTGKGSRILYDPTVTDLYKIRQSLPDTYTINLVKEEASTSTSLN